MYFDRNATKNGAKRSGSGGMHRRPNAAWVLPQAVKPAPRPRRVPEPSPHGRGAARGSDRLPAVDACERVGVSSRPLPYLDKSLIYRIVRSISKAWVSRSVSLTSTTTRNPLSRNVRHSKLGTRPLPPGRGRAPSTRGHSLSQSGRSAQHDPRRGIESKGAAGHRTPESRSASKSGSSGRSAWRGSPALRRCALMPGLEVQPLPLQHAMAVPQPTLPPILRGRERHPRRPHQATHHRQQLRV